MELAREWVARAEENDPDGMADLVADDALFHAEMIRGRRFRGRAEIDAFVRQSGFEVTGYTYTAVEEQYAVVTMSLRRRLPSGGLADSTVAMVFKSDGGEIICMDAFPTAWAALASLRR